ncbi:predicted protein [Nematostella vectensis]|uniref:Uncharacterized protein n=1 Tax=Nematostella vectensis TaxID=45351 RepID=A7SPC0_NEMVE|nr:predicted protein [Nematostella vectensis]|eukprot:XP_001626547.1 predicted protein [Nematostella vectensis]
MDDYQVIEELFLQHFALERDSQLVKAVYTFHEMVFRCSWHGFACVRYSLPRLGLLSQEAVVKVVLSDQKQIPYPDNDGFTVSPGVSAAVGTLLIQNDNIKRAMVRLYENEMQRMIQKSDKGFNDSMHKDKDILRKNFVRVKIYFEELNTETIT